MNIPVAALHMGKYIRGLNSQKGLLAQREWVCVLEMGQLFPVWDCSNDSGKIWQDLPYQRDLPWLQYLRALVLCGLANRLFCCRTFEVANLGINGAHYGSISILFLLSEVGPLFLCLRAIFIFSRWSIYSYHMPIIFFLLLTVFSYRFPMALYIQQLFSWT